MSKIFPINQTNEIEVFYATTQVFTFPVPTGTPAGTEFKLSIREDRNPSLNSMCDATGTIADGVVTFSCDLLNATFLAVSKTSAKAWLEVYASGEVFIQRQINIACRAGSVAGNPPQPITLYYTKAEVDALLANKMPNVTGATVGQALIWGGTAWVPGEAGSVKSVNGNFPDAHGNVTITIPSLEGYATQQWVQSQGYLTEHQSLTAYATKTWVTQQGYLTEHQSLAGLQPLITADNKLSYSLLSGTPTIPSTAADVGALSLQGGTVRGNLKIVVDDNEVSFSEFGTSFGRPVVLSDSLVAGGVMNSAYDLTVGDGGLIISGGTTGQFLRKDAEGKATYQNATAEEMGALSATGGTVSGDIALRGLTASNVPDVTSVGATFTPHVLGHYGYTASNGDTVHITPPDNGKTIFDLDVTIPAGTVSFAFDQFINWKGGSVSFTPGTTQELRFEYVGGTFQAGYREPDLSQYAKADNVIPLTPTQNVGWIAKTDQNRNLLFYGAPGFRIFELGNRWLGWLTIYGDDVCVALASKKISIKRGDQGVTYAEVSSSGILSKSDVIATVNGGTVAMSELLARIEALENA